MLDYNKIIEKIKKVEKESQEFESETITDEVEQRSVLELVLGNNYAYQEILDMRIDKMGDTAVIAFDTVESFFEVKVSNIIYVKNGFPLFSISNFSQKGVDLLDLSRVELNSKNSFTIYQDNSNKVENRIRILTTEHEDGIKADGTENKDDIKTADIEKENGIKINDIDITNVYTNEDNYTSTHSYVTYVKDDEIIGFQCHGDLWWSSRESYFQRLEVVEKNIDKVNSKIGSRIDAVLGEDDIKKYEIHRKKDR